FKTMKSYNKEPDKLYFGIPSGSLQEQTTRLINAAGWPIEPSRRYDVVSPEDPRIIWRIRDRKEMAKLVAMGVVDAGITGRDYIFDTGQENDVEPVGDFIYSKKTNQPSRLALVADASIDNVDACKGQPIYTELLRLTRAKLREVCDFNKTDLARLNLSEGKTEAKISDGMAVAITEIVETGDTLKANGLRELTALFTSYPQLIANGDALKETWKREAVEMVRIGIDAQLQTEKDPQVMITMDVPSERVTDVTKLLPSCVAPTISQLTEPGWVSLSVLTGTKKSKLIPLKLLSSQLGVRGIVVTTPKMVYDQSLLKPKRFDS
ncbi:MAG TPA: ATP phosphoribosyltransferase, partial [Methylococcales bacterium]